MKKIIVNEIIEFSLSRTQTNPISITGVISFRNEFPEKDVYFALKKTNGKLFITAIGGNGISFEKLMLIGEVKTDLINKILYEYADVTSDELAKEVNHKQN